MPSTGICPLLHLLKEQRLKNFFPLVDIRGPTLLGLLFRTMYNTDPSAIGRRDSGSLVRSYFRLIHFVDVTKRLTSELLSWI